jgi:hypothetical protein
MLILEAAGWVVIPLLLGLIINKITDNPFPEE